MNVAINEADFVFITEASYTWCLWSLLATSDMQ